jgi:hypothetical protein
VLVLEVLVEFPAVSCDADAARVRRSRGWCCLVSFLDNVCWAGKVELGLDLFPGEGPLQDILIDQPP